MHVKNETILCFSIFDVICGGFFYVISGVFQILCQCLESFGLYTIGIELQKIYYN
jgi:hypothetical protein